MAKKKNDGANKGTDRGAKPAINIVEAESRHEAGHAVAAVHFGYRVFGIDIIPQVVPGTGGQMGKAGVDLVLPDPELLFGRGEEAVIGILVTLYAGFQAEKKVNPKAELEQNHEASDGGRAMRYAFAAMITPVIENGRMVMKGEDIDRNRERIKVLLKRADDEAAELVAKYENAIDALGALLLKRGRLHGGEVVRFLTIENNYVRSPSWIS